MVSKERQLFLRTHIFQILITAGLISWSTFFILYTNDLSLNVQISQTVLFGEKWQQLVR